MYEIVKELLVPLQPSRTRASYWIAWVNTQVPDPGEQRELVEALGEAHPKYWSSWLAEIIVIGVGVWLVVTALSGIVQWFVQRLLDKP